VELGYPNCALSDAPTAPIDHDVGDLRLPSPPPPLEDIEPARRRTAAEEARTLVEGNQVGALGTLSETGHPWASLVTYGLLADGSPVLMLSHLAEHGRNLERDPRVSLMVADGEQSTEALAHGRVTLLGAAEKAEGALEVEARKAHLAAVPSARAYAGFGDFSLWVIRVERVRWVGGYGRMDSVEADAYSGAEADPTAPSAAGAIAHLNEDHADALLAMARGLGGYPDAVEAHCTSIDRYGLELGVETPRGRATTRIAFAEAASDPNGLRAGTIELARRARSAAG
jgi:heme iron utilization protein